ncbi:MAG: hypothetical protein OXI77_13370 [Chloroflexota bacterium]|nr:hypothetical protein [Chloroflexota bacterium]MDE2908153.1 hypothetical protein [Chloroflexota bacterium]
MKQVALATTKAFFLLLVTVMALEFALQLAFPRLPKVLVEPMPQYLERLGYRLDTAHGALEYPARERVTYDVTPLSGDLYHLTCLKPADAQPFAPYEVSFLRDGHGFRNVEPWPEAVDLVIIGDSFTAAELIQRPFWQDLSQSTLILAVPGTGTLEQQRLFDAFALPRKPKTVVLAFFAGNDLDNTLFYANMLRQGMTRQEIAHLGKNPLDYSVIFRMLQFLFHSAAHAAVDCHYPVFAQTDPVRPVAFFGQTLPLLRRDKTSLLQSDELRLVRESIAEMTSALEANAGRLILMYIPQKAELYWRYLDAATKELIIDVESRNRNLSGLEAIDDNLTAQRDAMREVADEIGIAFLDLTPPLAAAVAEGEMPYFFADTHWNQLGHDIARNALLDYLIRSNKEL